VPRLYVHVGGRLLPTWATMGGLGAAVGAALFVALAHRAGVLITTSIVAANVAGFYGWTAISRSWHGRARYVLLEHALVAAASTVAITVATDRSPAQVLDPWVVSFALALGFGRIGCLLSGCCHGKPAMTGVRYRWRPPWLLGPVWHEIRVYPLQAVEAAGLVALAAVGTRLLAHPGLAAAAVPAAYAAMRFELELWRGDDRRYIGRLSHNQWTCLALVPLVALLDLRVAAAAAASMAMLAVLQRRRFAPPAIIVSSQTHMAALAAAVIAVRSGQEAQVAGVVLVPDGQGGVTAHGAWLPLRPGELQVIAAAVEASTASHAVRDRAQPTP
jgi:prolipoprotein diacylglyceryltransferase